MRIRSAWLRRSDSQRSLACWALSQNAAELPNRRDRRTAIAHRLPVINLRAICTYPEDYANPVEPSSVGGAKIARHRRAGDGYQPNR